MTTRNAQGSDVSVNVNELLSFAYTDKDGVPTERLVEVDTVRTSKGGQAIMTGFDFTRNEYRTFRVYNMRSVRAV